MNSRRTRRRHPIQHPPTPTPSVAWRNSNHRCKVVHSLPVSTTSYFRYVVSTVQSSISTANNGTVLNRHRRNLLSIYSIPKPTHFRPVSISLYSTINFKPKLRDQDPKLASDSNHSTSTEILFSKAFLSTPAY